MVSASRAKGHLPSVCPAASSMPSVVVTGSSANAVIARVCGHYAVQRRNDHGHGNSWSQISIQSQGKGKVFNVDLYSASS